MDEQIVTIELLPGLTVTIDPAQFELVGVPMHVKVDSANMAVVMDLSIATVEGQQESKIENILRVRTAR